MRQEVAYLEESSYNEVKRLQPGAHIFEVLRITRQGIDLFTGSTFMLQQEKNASFFIGPEEQSHKHLCMC
jgi:hypothetical protein